VFLTSFFVSKHNQKFITQDTPQVSPKKSFEVVRNDEVGACWCVFLSNKKEIILCLLQQISR
jgi:hypothetical protein